MRATRTLSKLIFYFCCSGGLLRRSISGPNPPVGFSRLRWSSAWHNPRNHWGLTSVTSYCTARSCPVALWYLLFVPFCDMTNAVSERLSRRNGHTCIHNFDTHTHWNLLISTYVPHAATHVSASMVTTLRPPDAKVTPKHVMACTTTSSAQAGVAFSSRTAVIPPWVWRDWGTSGYCGSSTPKAWQHSPRRSGHIRRLEHCCPTILQI